MKSVRTYGQPLFTIAVVHGGPGAPGEMAPVARGLASERGVLEPLQTAGAPNGQVAELKAVLEQQVMLPATLIGFSWGAWLSFIVAARYPALVKKLILIGSGPFEEKYAAGIEKTRLSRLSFPERAEVNSLMEVLHSPGSEGRGLAFARLGALFSKADAYNPTTYDLELLECQVDIFQRVWSEAAALRRSGHLLALAGQIEYPVVAIHGDYDPHPAEGVERPLSEVLKRFRFILLKQCGHRPWIERAVKDLFYQILKDNLRENE